MVTALSISSPPLPLVAIGNSHPSNKWREYFPLYVVKTDLIDAQPDRYGQVTFPAAFAPDPNHPFFSVTLPQAQYDFFRDILSTDNTPTPYFGLLFERNQFFGERVQTIQSASPKNPIRYTPISTAHSGTELLYSGVGLYDGDFKQVVEHNAFLWLSAGLTIFGYLQGKRGYTPPPKRPMELTLIEARREQYRRAEQGGWKELAPRFWQLEKLSRDDLIWFIRPTSSARADRITVRVGDVPNQRGLGFPTGAPQPASDSPGFYMTSHSTTSVSTASGLNQVATVPATEAIPVRISSPSTPPTTMNRVANTWIQSAQFMTGPRLPNNMEEPLYCPAAANNAPILDPAKPIPFSIEPNPFISPFVDSSDAGAIIRAPGVSKDAIRVAAEPSELHNAENFLQIITNVRIISELPLTINALNIVIAQARNTKDEDERKTLFQLLNKFILSSPQLFGLEPAHLLIHHFGRIVRELESEFQNTSTPAPARRLRIVSTDDQKFYSPEELLQNALIELSQIDIIETENEREFVSNLSIALEAMLSSRTFSHQNTPPYAQNVFENPLLLEILPVIARALIHSSDTLDLQILFLLKAVYENIETVNPWLIYEADQNSERIPAIIDLLYEGIFDADEDIQELCLHLLEKLELRAVDAPEVEPNWNTRLSTYTRNIHIEEDLELNLNRLNEIVRYQTLTDFYDEAIKILQDIEKLDFMNQYPEFIPTLDQGLRDTREQLQEDPSPLAQQLLTEIHASLTRLELAFE